ncbi:hypothetical protein GGS24DRAFT_501709 [Hypoxylon argillaceum]|nr:hypothetical protein GGS24DRAFT_501709 [Hypoxylon argillaceum]
MPFLGFLRPHASSNALIAPTGDFAGLEMPSSPRSRAFGFLKQKFGITKEAPSERYYYGARLLASSPPPPLGQAFGPVNERIRTEISYDEYGFDDIISGSDDDSDNDSNNADIEEMPEIAPELDADSLCWEVSPGFSEDDCCSIYSQSTASTVVAAAAHDTTFPASCCGASCGPLHRTRASAPCTSNASDGDSECDEPADLCDGDAWFMIPTDRRPAQSESESEDAASAQHVLLLSHSTATSNLLGPKDASEALETLPDPSMGHLTAHKPSSSPTPRLPLRIHPRFAARYGNDPNWGLRAIEEVAAEGFVVDVYG